MRIARYEINGQLGDLEDILSNDETEVKKMIVYGKDNDKLLVVHKTKGETLHNEGARLEQVKEVAASVRREQVYSELKNANQRCLYLLDKYQIPKSIALDVIDEVKVLEITEKESAFS